MTSNVNNTAILLIHCPDKPGILASVIEHKILAFKNRTVVFD